MSKTAQISRGDVERAWLRAGNACECKRAHHAHGSERCGRTIEWSERGRHGAGAWEAQKQTGDGSLEILCWDCHAKEI